MLGDGRNPILYLARNGQTVLNSVDREMMTVDGTHPTDVGFYCIATALYDVFKLYF